jgi:ArsR family transcriptional regulator
VKPEGLVPDDVSRAEETAVTSVTDPHQAHYELMADVFKSFAHPMRIRILEMLAAADEVSVSEFLEELGAEPSHVSHQLSVLRRQRLIAAERRGNQVSYRLTAVEAADVLSVGRTVLAGMVTRVGDFLQASTELPDISRSTARPPMAARTGDGDGSAA